MVDRARALIEELRLEPHPEGGYFKEIHRSDASVQPWDDRAARSAVTTIYYMLTAGQHSRWHRVRSDELWHFYEGDALDLLVASPTFDHFNRLTVGPTAGSSRPIQVVPAGWWQAARPQGAYTLLGCTVAPGFEYADFSFLCDDAKLLDALRHAAPDLAWLA